MTALQRRIAISFAVVVMIASLRGVLWHRFLVDYVETLARVERTHGALAGFETVLSTLQEAEAEQRGFLITGKPQHLELFRGARTRLERERTRFSRELSESPTARAAFEGLGPRIDASLASLDRAIAVRRREGFAAARRIVDADRDARLMDELRDEARALGERERLALGVELRRLSSRASWAPGFALVGTVVSVAVIVMLYRLIGGTALRRECDLSRENAALDRLARIDPLTGLPNRRHLDRALAESFAASIEEGAPLSLVVLDVDRFKRFNDTFGHPAGDDALRRVAAILRESIREPDVVARHGGEEFAVLLRGVDLDGAVMLAERLRRAIAEADWPLRPISASFGVATRDASVPEAARLVSLADRALYQSKSRGRNRVTHCHQIFGQALDPVCS